MNLNVTMSSPGKIRIERFNEEHELHTPLTDSFNRMLKGVINKNFGVVLDNEIKGIRRECQEHQGI